MRMAFPPHCLAHSDNCLPKAARSPPMSRSHACSHGPSHGMLTICSGRRTPPSSSAAAWRAAATPSLRNKSPNQSSVTPRASVSTTVMANAAPLRWPRSRTNRRTYSGHNTQVRTAAQAMATMNGRITKNPTHSRPPSTTPDSVLRSQCGVCASVMAAQGGDQTAVCTEAMPSAIQRHLLRQPVVLRQSIGIAWRCSRSVRLWCGRCHRGPVIAPLEPALY